MDFIKVKVLNDNREFDVERGMSLLELSREYRNKFKGYIVLAKVDGKIQELDIPLKDHCEITFIDTTSGIGYRAYQQGFALLLIYAVKQLMGEKTRVVIEHSIGKNFYCEIADVEITEELLQNIEEKMKDAVDAHLRFERKYFDIDTAKEIFARFGMQENINALKYNRYEPLSFIRLGNFYDRQYSYVCPSTGFLKNFKLHKKDSGLLLQMSDIHDPNNLNEIRDLPKLSQVFKESSRWAKILRADTVGMLNDAISKGKIKDIILISEALHEKKISKIADIITEQKKNVVLIAGPSSSGKTTFANRLCTQLRANCLNPRIISLDDYYKNREEAPLDEDGKPDFEILEALDVKQFNEDMLELINGNTVQIPRFNFLTGKREYKGDFIRLEKDDVIVIEGIHGLNKKLTELIPEENKYKIYISALTQLNLDDHNRIATTDTRFVRRLVRDYNTRGFDAESTFDIWPSVLRGELKNIFPFQEEADIMFNSSLIYELSVLKQFAEPILFRIDIGNPHYARSSRLVNFLDSFLNVSCLDVIPPNSIIREFIGGSCFYKW